MNKELFIVKNLKNDIKVGGSRTPSPSPHTSTIRTIEGDIWVYFLPGVLPSVFLFIWLASYQVDDLVTC